MNRLVASALLALVLLVGLGAPAAAHPQSTAGNQFTYTESVLVNNGAGNYSGFVEGIFTNGTIQVTAVNPNGTDNASYQYSVHDEDNQGYSQTQSSSGAFTFSSVTYHYIEGSDNQTAPGQSAAALTVWFDMDHSLQNGSTFSLLGDAFTVVSTDQPFPLATSSTGWVKTIYGDGTGSYPRNDVYGVFTASYHWQVYFDPATGFIVGYVYTETDSDGAGDGFTWTDTLAVTSTSYALTPATAPPTPPPAVASPISVAAELVLVLIVVIVLVAIVYALTRRRTAPLARHSVQGYTSFNTSYPPPPGLNMNVPGQPAVQQIVIKETVKTNCRYCGTLIDTTATVCPKCGAPRT